MFVTKNTSLKKLYIFLETIIMLSGVFFKTFKLLSAYFKNLFEFMPTPVAPIVGNNRINIIAGKDEDVSSVAAGATPACNLSSANTRTCEIDF